MKLIIIAVLFFLGTGSLIAQQFPEMETRHYTSDSSRFLPKNPWRTAAEVFGVNMGVWAVNRYVVKEDFARINGQTIKNNFKTGFVWDTDKFSTNLFAHPYHGSLYFNAARSNGMDFWQSVPFVIGGSLMWELFLENEPPSINDLLSTTGGGMAFGEITYRLSDLFLDDRTTGKERIGREILAGVLSPVRALNRIITGDAWKYRPHKGRAFSDVPVNFVLSVGPRFLAEQEKSRHGDVGMAVLFRVNYGNPYSDPAYSPYEWFQLRAQLDFFSGQPMVSEFNIIGALWGKQIWKKDRRVLSFGVFQHFDYYDSEHIKGSDIKSAPYRISQAVAAGPGFLYHKSSTPGDKVDIYGELYTNAIGLGGSLTDYFRIGERDYNLGSGYSVKTFAGITYNKQWTFFINLENYHIFTWKGYAPDVDFSKVDPNTFNVQGDKGNSRLAIFSPKLVYYSGKKWSIGLSYRHFSRDTNYKYHEKVQSSTYDLMLTLGVKL